MPGWWVGRRDGLNAMHFMADLQSRLAHRVQLTTDGHNTYLRAVDATFGSNIDYAMLIKQYGTPAVSELHPETRYSPATVTGTETAVIQGDPDPDYISTSYIERRNLMMRMGMWRMTRVANGFSKKVDNLSAAVALHFMHYNFCRPHKTLSKPYPTTPAMAAGVADQVWTAIEIARLL